MCTRGCHRRYDRERVVSSESSFQDSPDRVVVSRDSVAFRGTERSFLRGIERGQRKVVSREREIDR